MVKLDHDLWCVSRVERRTIKKMARSLNFGLTFICLGAVPFLCAACSASEGNENATGDGDGDSAVDPGDGDSVGDGDTVAGDGDTTGGDGDDTIDLPCTGAVCAGMSVCGDGLLAEDEVCDDGNEDDSDGCAADCLGVDEGFICPVPGQLCRVPLDAGSK
jgi:cysteine-rich repeat protein